MDKMPIISLIFYSIPEAYLLFNFGLIVLGQKINLLRIIASVLTFVSLSYFTRVLPLPFGLHTLIGIVGIIIIFKLILRLNLKKSIIATLISASTLIALENIVLYILQISFSLSLKEIWQSPTLRTVIGWPHLLIWAVITWYIYYNNINFKKHKDI
ncbi:MAG: hypothetical protein FH758_03880 [Firmicutes bacterium]|nr:hypothetical protein [Bacillota bacterium]